MINLSLSESYLSITNFQNAKIPDFTVITGINGAGKTHLLQSIANKKILAMSEQGHQLLRVRYFDWSSMTPREEDMYSGEQYRTSVLNSMQVIQHLRESFPWSDGPRSVIVKFGLEDRYISNPLTVLDEIDKVKKLVGDDKYGEFKKEFDNSIVNAHLSLLSHISNQHQVLQVLKSSGKNIITLNEKDFFSPKAATWGKDMFEQSFGSLFVNYRDALLRNDIATIQAQRGARADALSPEEFVALHGPAPWDFVNKAISDAGLDFEIDHPRLDDYVPYKPKLRKISKNITIPFHNLSSGEKIIMSFAFCLNHARNMASGYLKPDLLLFDEIDAPLHPSMCKGVMHTMINSIVNDLGIKVIATTHSPTTIALCPDDAVYTLDPVKQTVTHCGRSKALNILTSGVPTLAISFSGRKQVFVENDLDAKVYECIYRALLARLNTECSLQFLVTGTKVNGRHVGTGSSVVRLIVDQLSASENKSAFGLIDWDSSNCQSGRTYVLAEGRRDGLENVLFDPLIIGITIWRLFHNMKPAIPAYKDISLHEILNYDPIHIELFVDSITFRIFGSPPKDRVASEYEGGLIINVDSRVFTTDDHKYEELVKGAFSSFKNIHKFPYGENLHEIVSSAILPEYIDFIPIEFGSIFGKILNSDVH